MQMKGESELYTHVWKAPVLSVSAKSDLTFYCVVSNIMNGLLWVHKWLGISLPKKFKVVKKKNIVSA